MPIYVIRCRGCGKAEEIYFRSFDTSEYHCCYCGGRDGEKLPASPSFRLKNRAVGGFANTSSDAVKGG